MSMKVAAIIALMGIWWVFLYLGAVWQGEHTRARPAVDPRMTHCFTVRDRTLCQVELQSWDSRWGFDYGKIRE